MDVMILHPCVLIVYLAINQLYYMPMKESRKCLWYILKFNYLVLQFTVTDADQNENGDIRATMETRDIPFELQNTTVGLTLVLDKTLNETFQPVYNILMKAQDNPVDTTKTRYEFTHTIV